ncbi:hypothetical protein TrST_g11655 [Triparma strigata]|uniref:DUF1579 domain-containing protein n=1 Tax=Triparma strigata TaxID=1606541 RepID=A0A9W7BBW2_9STRA|nr:hypothetical protein TrST_g11655 [Triparma strigata]
MKLAPCIRIFLVLLSSFAVLADTRNLKKKDKFKRTPPTSDAFLADDASHTSGRAKSKTSGKGKGKGSASGSPILASAFSGLWEGVEFVHYRHDCFATNEMLDEIGAGYDLKLFLDCNDFGVCAGYTAWAANMTFIGYGGPLREDWFGSKNDIHGLAGKHQINTERSFILADTVGVTLRYFFWEVFDIDTLVMEVHRPGENFAFAETTYVRMPNNTENNFDE